ncbi:hypothetical protein OCAE111667_13555 [Occultella aeris]|uniref:Uncharacterized protein n=1 Tax=Occultella aeris TaxID=2761496 RepID=A0A7M4DEA9_9MICO|nr:hypothetical protein [Occultella aeris]VZO35223.1 hypothetical protein HALOF300_00449 [Occultella aeris]
MKADEFGVHYALCAPARLGDGSLQVFEQTGVVVGKVPDVHHYGPEMSFNFAWILAAIVPWLIGALLAYGVIRLGVKHGILDADRQRGRDASNSRYAGSQGGDIPAPLSPPPSSSPNR